jgi:hypothetical protein
MQVYYLSSFNEDGSDLEYVKLGWKNLEEYDPSQQRGRGHGGSRHLGESRCGFFGLAQPPPHSLPTPHYHGADL